MRSFRIIATLFLTLSLGLTQTSSRAAEAGKDYQLLSPAQPTENRGKIEVIEFFSYTCPHCFELEPTINAWARKLPRDVVLKRQPVIFSDSWEPMARAYFALDDLGLLNQLHADVFNAIHVEDRKLNKPEAFIEWAAARGVDKAKLKAAFHSFSTAAKVARARQIGRDYKLRGVPTLAVNGKYVTSASMTGSHEKALAVVDDLIEMERGRGAGN